MLFTIVKAVVKKVVKKVVSVVGHIAASLFAPSVNNPTSVHLMNLAGRELLFAGGVCLGVTRDMYKYAGLPACDDLHRFEKLSRKTLTILSFGCIIVGSVLLNVFSTCLV